ncbi:ABC transporter ATP-binding protein [Spirochaeta dissipatitropha]
MQSSVQLTDITVGYDDTAILKDISLSIPTGKITVILGESGCGKSTLLKTMLRLIQPNNGSISVLDKDVLSLDEAGWESLLLRIGVLFQNGALLNSMTLLENVALPLEQHTQLPPDIIHDLVHHQLARVGLGGDLYKLPGELSGGMRKRAALARAMILNPSILFCDEPSAGLDPVTARSLDDLLLELKQQYDMTIVVVTHEISSIKHIADGLIYLENGGVAFHGSLSQLNSPQTPDSVRRFFSISE